ncbi:MAG: hypothetical protein P1R74_12545, partial [Sedimenticola sp.]|nr:hypothetical protein [Sedimenticola sp.]
SCWKKRSSHKAGGIWEGFSWHTTLQQAGEELQRRLVAQDDLEGVQEVVNALRVSAHLIASAIISSSRPDSWVDRDDFNPDQDL